MSVIKYYDSLYPQVEIAVRTPPKDVKEVFPGEPILNDAIPVTLAEYDPKSKNAITAHHLKEYRRRTFSLVMLPEVHILFDRVLEGSEYWGELLKF